MGELSKADAERLRRTYLKTLDDTITKIREEFREMDFENTDKQMAMERLCEDTVRVCQQARSRLNGMMFLSAEDYR